MQCLHFHACVLKNIDVFFSPDGYDSSIRAVIDHERNRHVSGKIGSLRSGIIELLFNHAHRGHAVVIIIAEVAQLAVFIYVAIAWKNTRWNFNAGGDAGRRVAIWLFGAGPSVVLKLVTEAFKH